MNSVLFSVIYNEVGIIEYKVIFSIQNKLLFVSQAKTWERLNGFGKINVSLELFLEGLKGEKNYVWGRTKFVGPASVQQIE